MSTAATPTAAWPEQLLPDLVTEVPGPRSCALAERLGTVESRNVTHLGPPVPIFWARASGSNVWDVDGNRFLDLGGAFGVANVGHAHPAVVEAIARQSAELLHGMLVTFLEGAMIYGVFHGDLHGGNLFVMPDGRVALFDYGITGRMGEKQRHAFMRMMMTGAANDVRGQLEAFRELGALPEDADLDALITLLKIDHPVRDPTKMSGEELAAEILQSPGEWSAGALLRPLVYSRLAGYEVVNDAAQVRNPPFLVEGSDQRGLDSWGAFCWYLIGSAA